MLFSKYYNRLITANYQSANNEIDIALSHINKLEVGVSYPFLLELFNDLDNNILTELELKQCLDLIQNYVIRRQICSMKSSQLNKIFINIGKEIKSSKYFQNNYVSLFGNVLTSKANNFPDNKEIKQALETKSIYGMRKHKQYLLYMLENFDNNERVDVFNLISENRLNIEHIMPQILTKEWKNSLGTTFPEIHSKYLHVLGNLTLTGYNSKLSNKSFVEKQTMENGFKDSRLYLNKYLAEVSKWGEEEIKERHKMLVERFCKIFKYPPKLTFDLASENIYSLADDIDFTSTKIIKFDFLNQSFQVSNWSEFAIEVCKLLYDLDPTVLIKLSQDSVYKFILSTNVSRHRRSSKIAENIYLENHNDVATKLKNLKKIIAHFDLQLTDIEFYVIKSKAK